MTLHHIETSESETHLIEPQAAGREPIQGRGPWALAWRRLRKDKVAMISLVVILLIVLMAICAPLIAHLTGHPPNTQYRDTGLDESGLPVAPNSEFWLGTDELGRDVLVRIAYGARISLLVGVTATILIVILGVIILITAALFVPLEIRHPVAMGLFLLLTAVTFSLFGFLIGVWADNFEQLQLVPLLIVTPLTFLGGSFYSLDMLPPAWRIVSLFNPVVYLISGFRWSFYGTADVGVGISLAMTLAFFLICLGIVAWIFKTGYRLKS